MMCSSLGLKISASSRASFSARVAISSACRGVSAAATDSSTLTVLLPFFVPPVLEEAVDCSRQPITSPKSSQETESRTWATAERLPPWSPNVRRGYTSFGNKTSRTEMGVLYDAKPSNQQTRAISTHR